MKNPTIKEFIAQSLAAHSPVVIYRCDDTGEHQWAVALEADHSFWLNAFPTRAETLAWCKQHSLPAKVFRQSR